MTRKALTLTAALIILNGAALAGGAAVILKQAATERARFAEEVETAARTVTISCGAYDAKFIAHDFASIGDAKEAALKAAGDANGWLVCDYETKRAGANF